MERLGAVYDCLVQCCGAGGGHDQEEEGERTRLLTEQSDRSDRACQKYPTLRTQCRPKLLYKIYRSWSSCQYISILRQPLCQATRTEGSRQTPAGAGPEWAAGSPWVRGSPGFPQQDSQQSRSRYHWYQCDGPDSGTAGAPGHPGQIFYVQQETRSRFNISPSVSILFLIFQLVLRSLLNINWILKTHRDLKQVYKKFILI